MPCLRAPVCPGPRSIGRPGQHRAEHRGVGSAGEGLHDVAAAPHRAISDDVDIAATRLVEVVASSGRDIADGARHRHPDPEDIGGRVR